MLKNVILSKWEAEALESALEINGVVKANVVHWHAQNLWDGNRAPLNDLDLDTVCSALYVGYEIEAGPEDKVKSYYHDFNAAYEKAIVVNTLNLLNVSIKGINC